MGRIFIFIVAYRSRLLGRSAFIYLPTFLTRYGTAFLIVSFDLICRYILYGALFLSVSFDILRGFSSRLTISLFSMIILAYMGLQQFRVLFSTSSTKLRFQMYYQRYEEAVYFISRGLSLRFILIFIYHKAKTIPFLICFTMSS